MVLPSNQDQLRLRIFAGPNGSGKTTIIKSVRDAIVNGKKIDFGYYINADDIVANLQDKNFSFGKYNIKPRKSSILKFAERSGLLNAKFSLDALKKEFKLSHNKLLLKRIDFIQEIGQIIARYLRECMLRKSYRFTVETVFSHKSNLDFMSKAKKKGYKVYLYFVSTESPEINKFRVNYRVTQNGHYVPPAKIETRYYRSLELLYEASELAYQCFFFDNSRDDEPFRLINHFKLAGNKKNWDTQNKQKFTNWFLKYYWHKLKPPKSIKCLFKLQNLPNYKPGL